ncbi:DNA replication protein PSF2 [Sporobolomyces koalae]|uniref:DNA replication protein PSF2 n=1 Tax=Sporobolomyces koalae TaxID=500713 RepID=UPI0031799775
MAVHHSRRRGPLPHDIEFACLDSIASGHSLIELAHLDDHRQQPQRAASHLTPGDVEIVPLVKLGEIQGLDGPQVTYGPFNPPQKTRVPLWLALHLKKKRKCRIVAPQWLSTQYLEGILKEEQTSGEFSDLPRDYLEVAKVLLDVAMDDLNSPDRLRLLLKDIREARQAKIRQGLEALNSVHLGMPNLSQMEINELRPFFSQAFTRLAKLDPMAEELAYREDKWMHDPRGLQDEIEFGISGGQGQGEEGLYDY